MYENALVRVVPLTTLAQAPALSGTGLFVDKDRDVAVLAKILLQNFHFLTRMDTYRGWEVVAVVFLWLIADECDLTHAFSMEFINDLLYGKRTLDRLPACHGDKTVDE